MRRSRYIFGDLEQKTCVGLDPAQLGVLADHDLSSTGSRSVSTGEYQTVRELARPKSYEFLGAGAGKWTYDPITQLSSIATGRDLRSHYNPDLPVSRCAGTRCSGWEYMPGSTLFWCDAVAARSGGRRSDFNCGRRMSTLFTTDPSNVFVAKDDLLLRISDRFRIGRLAPPTRG